MTAKESNFERGAPSSSLPVKVWVPASLWFAVTVAAEATSSPKARTAWEARIVPSRVAKCRAITAVTVETIKVSLRGGDPNVFELTDPNEIYY